MKSILKYALWSLIGVVATVSTLLAYVALAFDPNAYKPQIIQAVKESTSRTLKLDGDIKLMLFPSIGAHLGKISLSEYNSTQEFASVEDASVSLAVWPLLKKQMVVNQVNVRGVKVHVNKEKNGTSNLDDLLAQNASVADQRQQDTQKTAVAFDVAGVLIEDCELKYDDQTTGQHVRISGLNLKTGRLATDVATPIEFSAHIESTQPRVDVTLHTTTTLSFNLERNKYSLKGMELNAQGGGLDITDLALKLAGEASADLEAQNYELNLFVLNVDGKKAGEPFEMQLTVPGFKWEREEMSGSNLVFKAKFDGAFGTASTVLSLPSFKGNLDKFTLQDMSLQAGLVQPEQTFSTKIDSLLIGSLKTKQFNLKDVRIDIKANGDNLPGKVIEAGLKGGVQADLERQSVHAKFAGGLMQSQVKAEVALNNFKVPAIRYDVEFDKLDLDPYLPPKTKQETSSNTVEPEQAFDLSALKDLNVSGSVRVGAFKAANVQLEKLRVDIKAKDGIATVEPLSAALYQGGINGSIRIDANTYAFDARQKLYGVEIAPLLKDAADLELAEGRGNVTLAVSTQGNTVGALKQALNGKAAIELADGAIRGIDLGKLIQGVQNLSKDSKAETLGINKDERTRFSEFKASFNIRNGVAHNDDLSAKSTILRLSGNGNVDVGRNKMDYNAKVILAKTDQGRTGTLPVRVYGPFDALRIKVDYAELLADIARQRLNDEKAALKQKLDAKKAASRAAAKAKLDAEKAAAKARAEEKLKQGLKGLFK